MNKKIKQIGIAAVMCILFLKPCISFGDANGFNGFIDVKVSAPEGFEHSIMINLLDKENVNYIIVAEPVNDWKANTKLPAGEYTVDYVSFETADTDFEIEYSDSLSITENSGTAFLISVNEKKDTVSTKQKETKMLEEQQSKKQELSFTGRLGKLAGSILRKNYISILIIAILLIYLEKGRRIRKRNG